MAITFKVLFPGRAIDSGRSVTKDPPGNSPLSQKHGPLSEQGEQ
jgi:hypothetical protein